MELNSPKPKFRCKLPLAAPLPLIEKSNGEIQIFTGVFNGFSVTIENEKDMKKFISMGYFGKANLSRSYPNFLGGEERTEILRKRQFDKRKSINPKSEKKVIKKVLVVPDSDSENEDYFTNLKPVFEIDSSKIKESVHLLLEEAFFLQNAIKCLELKYLGNLLTCEESWKLFTESDQYFQQNYITYYHFRTKNWVVKPGIKFGGDFLLYKQGPPYYHSSYVILSEICDKSLQRNKILTRRTMDTDSLTGLYRLCETAGKEIIIFQIIWPEEEINFNNLSNLEVKETVMKRWISSKERNDN